MHIFSSWSLPDEWHKTMTKQNQLILLKIENAPGLVITYSVTINANL